MAGEQGCGLGVGPPITSAGVASDGGGVGSGVGFLVSLSAAFTGGFLALARFLANVGFDFMEVVFFMPVNRARLGQ